MKSTTEDIYEEIDIIGHADTMQEVKQRARQRDNDTDGECHIVYSELKEDIQKYNFTNIKKPGYVADSQIAPELAELGVILLMFGGRAALLAQGSDGRQPHRRSRRHRPDRHRHPARCRPGQPARLAAARRQRIRPLLVGGQYSGAQGFGL